MKKSNQLFLAIILIFAFCFSSVVNLFAFATIGSEKKVPYYHSYGFNGTLSSEDWTAEKATVSGTSANQNSIAGNMGFNAHLMPRMDKINAPYTIEWSARFPEGKGMGILFSTGNTFEYTNSTILFTTNWNMVQIYSAKNGNKDKAVNDGGAAYKPALEYNKMKISIDELGFANMYLNDKPIKSWRDYSTCTPIKKDSEPYDVNPMTPTGKFDDCVKEVKIALVGTGSGGGYEVNDFKVSKGVDGVGEILFYDNFNANNLMAAWNQGTCLSKWMNVDGTISSKPNDGKLNMASSGKLINNVKLELPKNHTLFKLEFAFKAVALSNENTFDVVFGATNQSGAGAKMISFGKSAFTFEGKLTNYPEDVTMENKINSIRLVCDRTNTVHIFYSKGFGWNTNYIGIVENAVELGQVELDTNGFWGFSSKTASEIYAVDLNVNGDKDPTEAPKILVSHVKQKIYVGDELDLSISVTDDYYAESFITSTIQLEDSQNNVLKLSDKNTYQFNQAGRYSVTYTAKNPSAIGDYVEKFTSTETVSIIVLLKDNFEKIEENFTTDTATFETNKIAKNFILKADFVLESNIKISFGRVDTTGNEYFIAINKNKTVTTNLTTNTTILDFNLPESQGMTVVLTVRGAKAILAFVVDGEALGNLDIEKANFTGVVNAGNFKIEGDHLKLKSLSIVNTGSYTDIVPDDEEMDPIVPPTPEPEKPTGCKKGALSVPFGILTILLGALLCIKKY